MTEEEISNVKEFWLSIGDADGNAKEALWCANNGNRTACIMKLEWAAENMARAQMYLTMALAKIRNGSSS